VALGTPAAPGGFEERLARALPVEAAAPAPGRATVRPGRVDVALQAVHVDPR
jgi:hypothetical protein